MGNPRPPRAPAVALKADDDERWAQVVYALNDLQAANERARAALLHRDWPELVQLGTYLTDRAVSLVALADDAGRAHD